MTTTRTLALAAARTHARKAAAPRGAASAGGRPRRFRPVSTWMADAPRPSPRPATAADQSAISSSEPRTGRSACAW